MKLNLQGWSSFEKTTTSLFCPWRELCTELDERGSLLNSTQRSEIDKKRVLPSLDMSGTLKQEVDSAEEEAALFDNTERCEENMSPHTEADRTAESLCEQITHAEKG